MQNTHFILKEKFKKNSRASHFARNSKVGKRFVDWDGAAKMPIVISTGTNRKKTWKGFNKALSQLPLTIEKMASKI